MSASYGNKNHPLNRFQRVILIVRAVSSGSVWVSKSLLVSILAYGLFNLQIAVSELDPDCFRIDYSDPFNHLANDLVIIVRKAIEMFLQISCV